MRISRRQAIILRRASSRVVALTLTVAGGWAVAPAVSSTPYLPGAVDFQQRLPAVARIPVAAARSADHAHPNEGPVTHLSPVIKAPARFDAVGLARELRPTEMRARDEAGKWSGWVEAAHGDPAWFGGGDELQLRTRGWKPSGTLFYVNVSGDATAAAAALTAAREGVNDVVVAATSLLSAEVAGAGPPRPRIVSRKAWGAEREQGCPPRTGPEYGQMRAAVVHHTVSSVSYTEAEAPGMILAICRFHRYGQGWNDIGYNTLVDRFGNIYEGRDGGLAKAVIGAHAQGFNSQTTGAAALGTHTEREVSRAGLRGLARLLAWKLPVHGREADDKANLVSAGGEASRYPAGHRITTNRIIGHKRVGYTECPGTALNRQLDALIRKVQRRIDRAW